jgi:hypothetical protein
LARLSRNAADLKGPANSRGAHAQFPGDPAPGQALLAKLDHLIPAEDGPGTPHGLAGLAAVAAGVLQPATTRSLMTLRSSSAMAAMIVNIALPVGVEVSSAS